MVLDQWNQNTNIREDLLDIIPIFIHPYTPFIEDCTLKSALNTLFCVKTNFASASTVLENIHNWYRCPDSLDQLWRYIKDTIFIKLLSSKIHLIVNADKNPKSTAVPDFWYFRPIHFRARTDANQKKRTYINHKRWLEYSDG